MAETNRTWMRFQWRMHKLLWNLSGGRLGRKVIGMPVLELVTIGHKSGQERQILITYVEHNGFPAIIGTNAGRDVDPAWVKNLRANRKARARWNGRWRDVVATELSGNELDQVWGEAVAVNPGYATYAESLTRPVPIFRLDPRG
jgi:deazaflavin-dependent oxidoreductase (nitroreductase family)